ncbi:hypothetical protein [Microtetraspora malaysiensis]|uniref:Uncharacterized protein n=1 Tax=Microtetraspora malaysiensis TaxID=161358 RepID=A0ABW6SRV5_9ACTN
MRRTSPEGTATPRTSAQNRGSPTKWTTRGSRSTASHASSPAISLSSPDALTEVTALTASARGQPRWV